jgi:hypothetical protein
MPLAQLIDVPADQCGRTSLCVSLSERWKIDAVLAAKLVAMAVLLRTRGIPVSIISGYRTPFEQEQQGPTRAAVDLSTHTTFPATGADLRPGVPITDDVKRAIGNVAQLVGLRWGGGAPLDQNGIPVEPEWRHVDLGPRRG